MAALAYQDMSLAGTTVTYQAAAGGGDTCFPDDLGFLHVKNGGGAPINVTVTIPGQTFGQDNPDDVVAVTNGSEKMIGPLVGNFADASTFNVVIITYSAVTSVTVAIVRHPGRQPNLP